MKFHDPEQPSDDEAIEATAAAWLAQRDDGLSRDEEAAFARWCAADPRHEMVVTRLGATWAALRQLRNFRPEARVHPDRDLLRPDSARRRMIPVSPIATAAVAAALVLTALWWFAATKRAAGPAEQRYATSAEGYERVVLEDGSLLELNSKSDVAVRFAATERRVRLLHGEAHFTVAKNKLRPFVVEAGAVAVRAVGTAFSVRLGTSDVEVLVTEGKIEVDSEMERVVPNALIESNDEKARRGQRAPPLSLTANERVLISTVPSRLTVLAAIVEKVAPEAVREALAWQEPRLVFVDTPLAEAVAQFNRRNQVQLLVADAELETLPIGGSFRAENVDAFVRLLATDNDIVVERPDAARIVLRKTK